MIEAISWIANGLAVIGWLTNIKWRKQAMWIFTVATVLSTVYFSVTMQIPFIIRFSIYLVIDIVTLCHIYKKESGK